MTMKKTGLAVIVMLIIISMIYMAVRIGGSHASFEILLDAEHKVEYIKGQKQ